MPIGALISGGLGLIGSYYDNKRRREDQERANQQNKELAAAQQGWNRENQEFQNQWNQDMWNRKNKYDSSKSQMKRFLEAGLNPHLIYGQGSSPPSSPLQSASVAGYDRAEVKSLGDKFSLGSEAAGNAATIMQTSALESQKNLNHQNAALVATKNVGAAVDNKRNSVGLKLDNQLFDYNISAAQGLADTAQAHARSAESDAVVNEETQNTRIKQAKQKYQKEAAAIKNMKASTARIKTNQMIDQITLDLNRQGIYKTDHIITRIFTSLGLSKFLKNKMLPHLLPKF